MNESDSRHATELKLLATNLLRVANEILADAAPEPAVGERDTPLQEGWSDVNQEKILIKAIEIYKSRQRRSRHLPSELFGEPAWDILLDLFAARLQKKRISVTSACTASGVPLTTALRWLRVLEDSRMIERYDSETDQRVTWVKLTASASNSMFNFFKDIEQRYYNSDEISDQYLIVE